MNCFSGAVRARIRLGGHLRYRLPRKGNPWGHWWVEIGRYKISWAANLPDRKMVWWRQLWFQGRFKKEIG